MKNHRRSAARRHQQGFTLVEIGVVLVIIGLLLGAVLKGQELIASARVTNLTQAVNGYRAAINGFQDRYRLMPGDSSTAATAIGNGAVNCATSCNDGLIQYPQNTSLANNHLSASGFYSGPTLAAESASGPSSTGFLNNPGNGPIYVAYYDQYVTTTGTTPATFATGVYTGWNISSKMLGEMDRKVDDGNGWTGALRFALGGGAATTCVTTGTGVWIESSPGASCNAVLLF